MVKHTLTEILLAMAVLSLSEPLFSQDKSLIACSDSLYYQGIEMVNVGEYEKAVILLEKSADIRREQVGQDNLDYATILNSLGVCYCSIGNNTKALDYHQQALLIREKYLGKDNPYYASSLYNIGACYEKLGEYLAALEYHQRALSIREKTLGKNHPDYAASLNEIGYCYLCLCNYSRALEYCQQSLAIEEDVYGGGNLSSTAALNNIGACYSFLGDPGKAIEYHKQALSIKERVLGENHPDCALSLNNIGGCFSELGNYKDAIEYHQRALAIREKTLGKDHPDYASSLNNIGVCFSELGNYKDAIEYHQRALAIREKTLGKDHPDIALSLDNIGGSYYSLKYYRDAIEYHQRALAIREKTLGKDHPDCASSLNNIGACYGELGYYWIALENYQRALAIREKILGWNHPDYALSLDNISSCYLALGNYEKAADCIVTYVESTSTIVTRTFSSLTESQRELFWNNYKDFYTEWLFMYAAAFPSPKMRRAAYDGALLGKGLLLNADVEMRKLILESGDDEAMRMFNEMQESRIRLDKLYEDPVGKKDMIDSLNNDIEVRQQSLIRRSKVFGDYTRNLALKWTDVRDALGRKDIAIEFETYTRKDTTFYVALTLKEGYKEPHLVELFSSVDLERIRQAEYYRSTRMTDLVWGKLGGELSGAENVYFSPVGELNNISIEYLKDDDGEHLVSENRKYYRLTSTRELVKRRSSTRLSSATVYGGIVYDVLPTSRLTGEESESDLIALKASRPMMPPDSLLSASRGSWAYLSGTKVEADAISKTLQSRKIKCVLLEGEAGTEESFKAMSGAGTDVIHIATHGFYYTEREAARHGVESAAFMLGESSGAPKEDKSMTRSGLLFAGAQNAFDGKEIPIDVEDGILTAKDISRLDLRGTDMVVISACQSGLGEVTGDGVFGLQRGFKKAGVKSIVMSLWKVNDEATRIMMTRFYENLAKGQGRYSSFQEAQTYLRNYEDGVYDKPVDYAAFVLLDAIDD